MEGREFAHDLERTAIRRALRKNHGNIASTGRWLGMPYSTLCYKMKVLGLLPEAARMRAEAALKGIKLTGRPKGRGKGKRNENRRIALFKGKISPQAKVILDLAMEGEE